jgi:hypothetical protein
VDGLVKRGQVDQDLQHKLEKTLAPVDDILMLTLKRHRNALLREVCATVLGERRSVRSLPALVSALNDPSVPVRVDALWAIEKCVGLQPGQLSDTLMLNLSNWPEIRRRISGWWRLVKTEFI